MHVLCHPHTLSKYAELAQMVNHELDVRRGREPVAVLAGNEWSRVISGCIGA